MAEEDRVDISEEVNPPAPALSQPPPTHAPPPPTLAGMLPTYSGAPPVHLQPPTSSGAPLARTSQTSSASDDQTRIATLEGTVNQMATNMAELLALLRRPNRASSSSTPPPGQGPTVDPTPWVPPTQAPENMEPVRIGPRLVHVAEGRGHPDVGRPLPEVYQPIPILRGSASHPSGAEHERNGAGSKGVYYSHLLAHTSSFFDLIEAEKKLDLGIKLGRMEGPASKGEESSKKASATSLSSSGKRGKEVSVNAVNTAHQTPQQYSVNLTTAPTATPTYYPPPPQHQPQSIYYSAPPIPPPATSQSYDHYAPASIQPPQPRPPVSRAPPPAQQSPAAQGPQAGGMQSRPRKQYTPLPAPLSHIYRQLLAGNQIRPISPGLNFDPSVQDQSKRFGVTENVASPAPFVIDIPSPEPYADSKVPWTYEGSVESVEQQFSVMGMTRSGRVYENSATKDKGKALAAEVGAAPESSPFPSKKVTEEEVEAFMKIVKEPHREALLRVLTAAQVPKGTPPYRIEETVGSIFSNTISFSDDELPSEGWSHSRALHIVCKCNNYIIGRVMIDNGSTLNVCPVTTLKQMNVDLNRVLDIPSAFSLLLGRPWIHSAGAVPSSLHQRLKFIIEEKLITVKGEEDYAIYKETAARRGNHLHRLAAHYGRLNRGSPVPPLLHFFPGPSHTIGGTLDGPSSDFDDTPAAPSTVYIVTEELPSGVHIRLAQENEELDN
ncbi:hypothetical protein CRG98_013806 [Punica granatum]|uniref:Uncharacterized protein n=1 Tax=Punica granatum TaxID=22663 RepID=A0A2I0KB99_PUNGR|nr:hypothetical protein CRG98_013806 [Punica granatum]